MEILRAVSQKTKNANLGLVNLDVLSIPATTLKSLYEQGMFLLELSLSVHDVCSANTSVRKRSSHS